MYNFVRMPFVTVAFLVTVAILMLGAEDGYKTCAVLLGMTSLVLEPVALVMAILLLRYGYKIYRTQLHIAHLIQEKIRVQNRAIIRE
jgi:hypothetical protein